LYNIIQNCTTRVRDCCFEGLAPAANDLAVRRALEAAGVEFIDANGGGPGVRLRERLRTLATVSLQVTLFVRGRSGQSLKVEVPTGSLAVQ